MSPKHGLQLRLGTKTRSTPSPGDTRGIKLKSYFITDPATERQIVLSPRSYARGALFGPLYILGHGHTFLAFLMAVISLGSFVCAIEIYKLAHLWRGDPISKAITSTLIFSSWLAVHGMISVELVRLGYLQRGWQEARHS